MIISTSFFLNRTQPLPRKTEGKAGKFGVVMSLAGKAICFIMSYASLL
jgi:hypothetical protein